MIFVCRLSFVAMPFDSSVSEGKLLNIKIIPDKEIRKNPWSAFGKTQEIMVSIVC
jgi:hypothetical protein